MATSLSQSTAASAKSRYLAALHGDSAPVELKVNRSPNQYSKTSAKDVAAGSSRGVLASYPPPPPPPPPPPKVAKNSMHSGSERVLARWQVATAGEKSLQANQKSTGFVANIVPPPPPPPPIEDKKKRMSPHFITKSEVPSWVKKQSSSIEDEPNAGHGGIKDVPRNSVQTSSFLQASLNLTSQNSSSIPNEQRQCVVSQSPRKFQVNQSTSAPESPRNQWDTKEIPVGAVSHINKDKFLNFESQNTGVENRMMSPQLRQMKSQWMPDAEIPPGTVSGRKAAFIGGTASGKKTSLSGSGKPLDLLGAGSTNFGTLTTDDPAMQHLTAPPTTTSVSTRDVGRSTFGSGSLSADSALDMLVPQTASPRRLAEPPTPTPDSVSALEIGLDTFGSASVSSDSALDMLAPQLSSPLSLAEPTISPHKSNVDDPRESDPWSVPIVASGHPCWGDEDVPQSTSQDIWDDGHDWFGENNDGDDEADNDFVDKVLMSPTNDTLESSEVYLSESNSEDDAFAQVMSTRSSTSNSLMNIVNSQLHSSNAHRHMPPILTISESMSSPRSAGPVDVDDSCSDENGDDPEEDIVKILPKIALSLTTAKSTAPPSLPVTPIAAIPSQHTSLDVAIETPTLFLNSPETTEIDENVSGAIPLKAADEEELFVVQSDVKKKEGKKRRGILKFFGINKDSFKKKDTKEVKNNKNLAKSKNTRGGKDVRGKTVHDSDSKQLVEGSKQDDRAGPVVPVVTLQEERSSTKEPVTVDELVVPLETAHDMRAVLVPLKTLPESSSTNGRPTKTAKPFSIENNPADDGQENVKTSPSKPSHFSYQTGLDDGSIVSEMTNPTVFTKIKALEALEEKSSGPSVVEDYAVTVAPKPVLLTEETANNLTTRQALDPFDLNSPVFASGDPFGFGNMDMSTQDADPFGDFFFESASVSSQLTPRQSQRAVEPLLAQSLQDSEPIADSRMPSLAVKSFYQEVPEQGLSPKFAIRVESPKINLEPEEPFDFSGSEIDLKNSAEMEPPSLSRKPDPIQSPLNHVPIDTIPVVDGDSDPEIYMASTDEEEENGIHSNEVETLNQRLSVSSGGLPLASLVFNNGDSLDLNKNSPDCTPRRGSHRDISKISIRSRNPELQVETDDRSWSSPVSLKSANEACSMPSKDQSFDSSAAVYPSQSAALNNKLRKKRTEKKLRKAGILDEKAQENDVYQTSPSPRTAPLRASISLGVQEDKANESTEKAIEHSSSPSLTTTAPSVLTTRYSNSSVPPRTEQVSLSPKAGNVDDAISRSIVKAMVPDKESDAVSVISGTSTLSRDAMKIRRPAKNDSSEVVEVLAKGTNRNLPRSILRKPNRAVAEADKPALGFDENKVTDPMHRAGLRLLAAAVIPIQAAIRRFLAKREALNRMWAIVTIQTYTRRWFVQKQLADKNNAAITIQKVFRGWFARDFVEDQHYCATQIQRVVRGYFATLAVYEAIYKVTLIQSYVRMKIAVDEATYKMAFIIQLQSIIRSYLVRKQRQRLDAYATVIQKSWRCHATRQNYQFDVLDIVLVQCLYRQNKARALVEKKRQERFVKCATILQAQWRSYDCTMNYLHYLADVLIVQSTIRRWTAATHVRKLRNQLNFSSARKIQSQARGFIVRNNIQRINAATSIQTAWRGFVCYADYMFTIADVVIVQTCMRSWLARRESDAVRLARDNEYIKPLQTLWRGYNARQNFISYRKNVILSQSVIRRFVAWSKYMKALTEKYAAETIQRGWWDYLIRRDERYAATSIQRVWRGYHCQTLYKAEIRDFRAARTIQTAWRKFWLFSNFIIMLDSAIRIQAIARGVVARNYMEEMNVAATMIQSHIRCFLARRTASRMSMIDAVMSSGRAIAGNETNAAIALQSHVRGFQARFAVLLFLKVRLIQAFWRGTKERHAWVIYRSSRKIQAAWRGSIPRRSYNQYRAAVRIQSCWRRASARDEYVKYTSPSSAGVRIKRWLIFRRDNSNWVYFITRHRAAIRIQTWFRSQRDFVNYEQYRRLTVAAIVIQKAWRGFLCYTDYIFTVADIITVQRVCRGFIGRHRAYHIWLQIKQEESAFIIQRVYRGHRVRSGPELHSLVVQYRERRYNFATIIQRHWRGFDKKRRYWYLLGCCLQAQRIIRGSMVRMRLVKERESVVMIQSVMRRYMAREKVMQLRFTLILRRSAENEIRTRIAAKKVQFWYKRVLQNRREHRSACKIQGFFLMVKAMVEREVRAEKKRRKLRKLMKNRTPAIDEMLLEDAWADSVSPRNEPRPDIVRRAEMAAANALNGSHGGSRSRRSSSPSVSHHLQTSKSAENTSNAANSKIHHRTGSGGGVAKVRTGVTVHRSFTLSTRAERKRQDQEAASRAGSQYNQKNYPPSVYTTKVYGDHVSIAPYIMKEHQDEPGHHPDDDDCLSEVSGLTSAASHFRQPPPARLKTLTKRDLDDDFSLEEAWIDTEILSVKERMLRSAEQRHSSLDDNLNTSGHMTTALSLQTTQGSIKNRAPPPVETYPR